MYLNRSTAAWARRHEGLLHNRPLCQAPLPTLRLSIFVILAFVATIIAPAMAQQDYPNRPITLVVPYAAGGGNDVFARIAAEKMSKTLKTFSQ
jgi:hypothetical protein